MKRQKKRERQARFETLTLAMATGAMLEYRTYTDPGVREFGYVFGLTEKFVLIQVISKHVLLDGYAMFPLREISRVKINEESFLARALPLLGFTPAAPNGVILDDWQSLLASADAHFPLVTIHPELKYPGTCYIGRVSDLKKRSVVLRKIDPQARWQEKRETFRFKDITQVSFGGRYEAALWRVAQSELSNSDSS